MEAEARCCDPTRLGRISWKTPRSSHLCEKLCDIVVSLSKGMPSLGSGVIAPLPSPVGGALAEISPISEPVQQRVQRARPDRVAVPAKLLDERQPINVAFGGVMQYVKRYQTAPKICMATSWTQTH